MRHCTHLDWINPEASFSSMLLLAGAFTDDVAVYLVPLPLVFTLAIRSTSISKLHQHQQEGFYRSITKHGKNVPCLFPIAIGRVDPPAISFTSNGQSYQPSKYMVLWIDFGPSCPPCLGILFESVSVGHTPE